MYKIPHQILCWFGIMTLSIEMELKAKLYADTV